MIIELLLSAMGSAKYFMYIILCDIHKNPKKPVSCIFILEKKEI